MAEAPAELLQIVAQGLDADRAAGVGDRRRPDQQDRAKPAGRGQHGPGVEQALGRRHAGDSVLVSGVVDSEGEDDPARLLGDQPGVGLAAPDPGELGRGGAADSEIVERDLAPAGQRPPHPAQVVGIAHPGESTRRPNELTENLNSSSELADVDAVVGGEVICANLHGPGLRRFARPAGLGQR